MLNKPARLHPVTKSRRRIEFLGLLMLHAVMGEVAQIQRVGEIVQVRQGVRHVELP